MAVVLLYHAVAEVVVDELLQVRESTIDRHLGWCREIGFEIVSLADALAFSAEKLAAVTFDDGLASIEGTIAGLVDRGVVPTVFLCPGMIGGVNRWASPGRACEPLLDVVAVRRLQGLGVNFGGHGWDHRAFEGRTADDMRADLAACRDWFRSTLGDNPKHFAWPFGRFDATAVEVVGRIFCHALAVEPGWGEEVSPLAIPRVFAVEGMDFASFADALELAEFVLDPSTRRTGQATGAAPSPWTPRPGVG